MCTGDSCVTVAHGYLINCKMTQFLLRWTYKKCRIFMVLMQELVKLKTFQLDIFYSYSISSQMLYKKTQWIFLDAWRRHSPYRTASVSWFQSHEWNANCFSLDQKTALAHIPFLTVNHTDFLRNECFSFTWTEHWTSLMMYNHFGSDWNFNRTIHKWFLEI